MKTGWLVLAWLAAGTSASAQELQNFSFRQLNSAFTYDAATKAGLLDPRCMQGTEPLGGGRMRTIHQCLTVPGVFGSVVGAIPLRWSQATFDQVGFIGYSFSVFGQSYPALRNVLIEKYGQPCGEREGIAKTYGTQAPLKQHLTDWCFKDGALTLADRANANPEEANATYKAYRWTRNEPLPNVDF
jgi:hypothetical protein